MTTDRPSRRLFLGMLASGLTLPFVPSSALAKCSLPVSADQRRMIELLRSAPVVARRPIGSGINETWRLTLELEGERTDAAFRTGDTEYRTTDPRRRVRDHYAFEVAAYELSRLLGLQHVPVTVLREIDGVHGSLQRWVANAYDGIRAVVEYTGSAEVARRERQAQTLRTFDALIYNWDRHPGNVLYDQSGEIFYIDHTRAFRDSSHLPPAKKLRRLDPQFIQRLRDLDRKTVSCRLSQYLTPLELRALFVRRQLLLSHLKALVKEDGGARSLAT